MAEIATLAKLYAQANKAVTLSNAAMMEFDAYCTAHDWENAEMARLRVMSYMESYLDNIASIHKSLERA